MKTLWDRFWEKVDATGDCWEWTAYKDEKGYGRIHVSSKPKRAMTAQDVAWELLVGPIPAGMVVDHLCRNHGCVNAGSHLELVTRRVNYERGYSLQRINSKKTHCPQGHLYTAENTYVLPSRPTARYCKTCHKDTSPERAARRRARPEKRAFDNEQNRLRMLGYRKTHPPNDEQKAATLLRQRERRRAIRAGTPLADRRNPANRNGVEG